MTYTEYIDGIPVHPYAAAYPMMSEGELQDLADDIKANGQHEPITLTTFDPELFDGWFIIDGRNRYAACKIAGVEPWIEREFIITPVSGGRRIMVEPTEESVRAWIKSKNLHRRHLTPEQKREQIKAALSRNPELPDYQIAKRTNTSPHTVKRVRQDNPDLQGANERVNARGQKRPATYSRVPAEVDRELEAAARAKSSAPDSSPYVTGDSAASRNGQRLDALKITRRMTKDARDLVALLSDVGGVEGVREQLGEVAQLIGLALSANEGEGIDAGLARLLGD